MIIRISTRDPNVTPLKAPDWLIRLWPKRRDPQIPKQKHTTTPDFTASTSTLLGNSGRHSTLHHVRSSSTCMGRYPLTCTPLHPTLTGTTDFTYSNLSSSVSMKWSWRKRLATRWTCNYGAYCQGHQRLLFTCALFDSSLIGWNSDKLPVELWHTVHLINMFLNHGCSSYYRNPSATCYCETTSSCVFIFKLRPAST